MEKFQVLPTDQRFQDLTTDQISFIMANMEEDANEQARAMKSGGKGDEFFEDYDEEWQTADDFDPLDVVEDEEALAQQLEDMSSKEELEEVAKRMKSTQDWIDYYNNGGKETERIRDEKIISESLKAVYEEAEAKARGEETKPYVERDGIDADPEDIQVHDYETMTEDDIQEAMALFEGTDSDEDTII